MMDSLPYSHLVPPPSEILPARPTPISTLFRDWPRLAEHEVDSGRLHRSFVRHGCSFPSTKSSAASGQQQRPSKPVPRDSDLLVSIPRGQLSQPYPAGNVTTSKASLTETTEHESVNRPSVVLATTLSTILSPQTQDPSSSRPSIDLTTSQARATCSALSLSLRFAHCRWWRTETPQRTIRD